MDDDRQPLTLAPDYAAAIGTALFAFATLEWTAVRCCEKLEPGSIDALADRTAGRVADTLVHLARTLATSPAQARLAKAAGDFEFLVGTRNNLVHARPGSASDGTPALFRDGDQWLLSELTAVATAFAACHHALEQALTELPPR